MPSITITRPDHERRRDVRLRPVPDLPARARLVDAELDLTVRDVSVGGLAVKLPAAGSMLVPDTRHRVHIDLGSFGAFDLEAEIRHRSTDADGTVGMQLVDPPRDATRAIGRYVGELLERGALS